MPSRRSIRKAWLYQRHIHLSRLHRQLCLDEPRQCCVCREPLGCRAFCQQDENHMCEFRALHRCQCKFEYIKCRLRIEFRIFDNDNNSQVKHNKQVDVEQFIGCFLVFVSIKYRIGSLCWLECCDFTLCGSCFFDMINTRYDSAE